MNFYFYNALRGLINYFSQTQTISISQLSSLSAHTFFYIYSKRTLTKVTVGPLPATRALTRVTRHAVHTCCAVLARI